MLKKIFKALTTLTLLTGGYFVYVHAFAILVEQLKATRQTDNFAFPIHDSKSLQDSIRYAIEACGPDHWAADKELAYRYYNAERGYWIYAKECIRVTEENGVRYDGKRMRMKPFLLITKSHDGKNTKIITADRAVFDLNAPLGFDANTGREPLKIKHAHLEPNVWVRDEKGTPLDSSDDLKIGPLTTVDYEESTQQITTEADTHVVMQDPDMTTTGDGMVMQLRKMDSSEAGTSSMGFQGIERLDLLKNAHVTIRDVGKSGMLPGSGPAGKAAPQTSQGQDTIAIGPDQNANQPAKPVEPTPLDLRCDSKMQIFVPRSKSPVLVGPPAPPAPTLALFERNVVVLRGDPEDAPDQLTCDTLKLTLIPNDKPPPQEAPTSKPKNEAPQSAEGLAQGDPASKATIEPGPSGDANQGLFGGLTLQRAHATGHAVWLILPKNGIKLRCNEMIHSRQLPIKPDQTYFRGDRTRPVEIVKVDVQHNDDAEETADQEKVTSVTNIWTVDLTLFDNGDGMDAANVVAHGPGRLETRPDRDQPVERIAIWQDKLIVMNTLDGDNKLLHKKIDLTGNRPCFIDNLQKTSLDSASWIQVWLKPKPASSTTVKSDRAPAVAALDAIGSQNGAVPMTIASVDNAKRRSSSGDSSAGRESPTKADMGGGNLQIEQLHALVDVHLLAPAKTMIARSKLDAEFIEAEPTEVASTTAANSKTDSNPTPSAAADMSPTAPEQAKSQDGEQVAARQDEEKQPTEPLMNGSCDRMWARIALKPKSESNTDSTEQTLPTKTTSAKPKAGEMNAEIRKVWMFGNVALHQDAKEDKRNEKKSDGPDNRGMDASGEALYLDNRGTNKVITYVYQRDPTEKTLLPDPLPPARVANIDRDDVKVITGAGVIRMNQETDQAWVEGPGTLTQLADRGFLTDKAPGGDEEASDRGADGNADPKANSRGTPVKVRSTSMARNDVPEERATSNDNAVDAKPKTRAGVPLSKKVPMTIAFSEKMEFTGRSVDPEGRPAARADFHGIVLAEMEDAMLYCTEKMITFTDREVPLTQLGKMSQKPSPSKSDGAAEADDAEPEPQAQLALLFCYRNAVGISRKVDPDLPVPIQQQRIEADNILAYDRRTGDFYVKGKGKVFLYDRDAKSSQAPAQDPDRKNDTVRVDRRDPGATPTQRRVTQTAGTGLSRGRESTAAKTAGVRDSRTVTDLQQYDEQDRSALPKLVLTQIHFNKLMIGRFGSGKQNDKTDDRWSEFYGNVEAFRANVASTTNRLDPDRLPADGLFLTGQTLDVVQEPPPVGAPEATPARQYMKATEKAYAWSHDKALNADIITYDSYKDLVYAYGQDGHNVVFAEQHAVGQPISPGSAEAVQLNPKTGAVRLINSSTIGLIDKNTGYRPSAAAPDDPYAKKKKPVKKPFRLPPMNVERRGWTGT